MCVCIEHKYIEGFLYVANKKALKIPLLCKKHLIKHKNMFMYFVPIINNTKIASL